MKNKELKAIRTELKMTQKTLAGAIDVPLPTYQGWEQGRPMPAMAVRAINMLLWMDQGARETFLNYIRSQQNDKANSDD